MRCRPMFELLVLQSISNLLFNITGHGSQAAYMHTFCITLTAFLIYSHVAEICLFRMAHLY
jgi:hypothetical protein